MAYSKKEQIIVERHSFESLVIYEVTGQELEQMERETLSISEDFSFAVAGLSVAVTVAAALLTVDVASERIYHSFFVTMVLGFLVFLYCGIKWLRGKRSYKSTVQRIKQRV